MSVNDQELLAQFADVYGTPVKSVLLHGILGKLLTRDPTGMTGPAIEDNLTQWFFGLFAPAFPTTHLDSPGIGASAVPLPLTGAYQDFAAAVADTPTVPTDDKSSVLWRLGYSLDKRNAASQDRVDPPLGSSRGCED